MMRSDLVISPFAFVVRNGKHVDADTLVWALAALAEGLGMRAVARVCAVDPNTVVRWLVEAAEPLEAVARYLLHEVHAEPGQMAERCALLRAVTEHNFVLPHASLRLPLPNTKDQMASGNRWRQRTPALAAGLTEHAWSLSEVLRCRVPPWPQPHVG